MSPATCTRAARPKIPTDASAGKLSLGEINLGYRPFYSDAESRVEIYNADSTDLSFLPPAGIHLVVTSPPYNLGKDYGTARDDKTYQQYLDWTKQWGAALTHVLTPGSRVCVNIPIDINLAFQLNGRKTATKQAVLADMTRLFVHELGYIYNTTILWLERNVSRRTAWGSWLSASDPWVNTAAEAILVLSHQTRKRNGRGRQSDLERDEFMDWVLGLWDFPGESRTQYRHPAAFPEELPRRLIKLFSFAGDTVLDPFLGSGTTCAVAKTLGRRASGWTSTPTSAQWPPSAATKSLRRPPQSMSRTPIRLRFPPKPIGPILLLPMCLICTLVASSPSMGED